MMHPESHRSVSPRRHQRVPCISAAGKRGIDKEDREGDEPQQSGNSSSSKDIPKYDNDDDDDDEQVEAAPIHIARDPGSPTPAEIEARNVTHLPHRS